MIASVTQPFCRTCTRARLATDGKLYTCLFAAAGHDLRALLRGGATDQELTAALAAIWGAAATVTPSCAPLGPAPPSGSR